MGIKNANGYSWRISRLFQMFSTANMGLLFETAKEIAKKILVVKYHFLGAMNLSTVASLLLYSSILAADNVFL